MYEVGLDIRSQLRVFEQIDEVERKKRDARERDILMRAAKVSDCLIFTCTIHICQSDHNIANSSYIHSLLTLPFLR